MTVAELIALLKTQPQDLLVAFPLYSEYVTLEPQNVEAVVLQTVRPDGWIGRYRKDKPTTTYLIIGEG